MKSSRNLYICIRGKVSRSRHCSYLKGKPCLHAVAYGHTLVRLTTLSFLIVFCGHRSLIHNCVDHSSHKDAPFSKKGQGRQSVRDLTFSREFWSVQTNHFVMLFPWSLEVCNLHWLVFVSTGHVRER